MFIILNLCYPQFLFFSVGPVFDLAAMGNYQPTPLDKGGNPVNSSGGVTCRYCGKREPCMAKLLVHERKHTGEKPFKCDACGKGFKSRSNLRSHMVVHLT